MIESRGDIQVSSQKVNKWRFQECYIEKGSEATWLYAQRENFVIG